MAQGHIAGQGQIWVTSERRQPGSRVSAPKATTKLLTKGLRFRKQRALSSHPPWSPRLEMLGAFFHSLPPLAGEETEDGEGLSPKSWSKCRGRNLVSWPSSAHSPPCWGGMSRSWGKELLLLLETLRESWVRKPQSFHHKPREWVGNHLSSPGRFHLAGCLHPARRGFQQWRRNWGVGGPTHTKPNRSGGLSSSLVPRLIH